MVIGDDLDTYWYSSIFVSERSQVETQDQDDKTEDEVWNQQVQLTIAASTQVNQRFWANYNHSNQVLMTKDQCVSLGGLNSTRFAQKLLEYIISQHKIWNTSSPQDNVWKENFQLPRMQCERLVM